MNLKNRLYAVFADLSFKARLGMTFAVVLLMTTVLGGAGLFSLYFIKTETDALAKKWMPGVGHLAKARAGVLEFRYFEVKLTEATDPSYYPEYEEKMAQQREIVESSLSGYDKLAGQGGEEAALFNKLRKEWSSYLGINQKIVTLVNQNQQVDARDISDGAAKTSADDTMIALDALTAFNFDQANLAATHADEIQKQTKLLNAVAILVIMIITGILAVAISRSLLRQLGGEPALAMAIARAVAQGDLNTVVQLRPGDTTSLMATLATMQTRLAAMVAEVRNNAEILATTSTQIHQGNVSLSDRTEEQAGALEKTGVSVQELGSTATQNSEYALQANQLAIDASKVAIQGGEVVAQVVETMRGINASSNKIADIIGVIDGIAFQTNILALNAAVEAARAGEQGRGFAVVASEVRSLAQRSASAAKEIKELISASVDRVEQGTSLVDRAGSTMDEVVAHIKRVTDIMGDIAQASNTQKSGVGQVGDAISQIDQATRQNAVLVEQSAAAVDHLKRQATQLVQLVAAFKL